MARYLQKHYRDEYPNYYGGGYDVTFYDRFYLDGQNAIAGGKIIDIPVIYDGYLIGAGLKLDTQRTAGTVGIVLYKNNVALSDTDLNIQLNDSYPLDRIQQIAFRTDSFNFSAGDILTVKLNVSSTIVPKSNIGIMYLMYKVNREL